MSSRPINDEISAVLGQFFFGGSGPSHTVLTRAFTAAGLAQYDRYDATTGTPNKQQRVMEVCQAAKHPDAAKKLADGLLNALRLNGSFKDADNIALFADLRSAFRHAGWSLSDDGRLERVGSIDLETGGRAALDEQLERLRRNMDDPAAVLGIAKDLVEAVSKFVLEDGGMTPPKDAQFDWLVYLAFERLKFTTGVIDESVPGAKQLRAIFKSAQTIVLQLNELRNLQGTGHGRTLPTGLSKETARFVIREVTHVTELMLSTHDHQMGRG